MQEQDVKWLIKQQEMHQKGIEMAVDRIHDHKKELRNPEFEKSGRYQENSVFISVSDVLLVKDNPIKNKKNQYR